MDRWQRMIAAGLVALSCCAEAAWASVEVDMLLNKLVDKGVLTKQEASELRGEMAEYKDAANKQLAKEIVPEHARNWKWKGDIRLRDEIRNRVGTGNDSHRQRIRFRYGVEGKVSDELKANFRLATGTPATSGVSGNPDPISTNQSFDTNFAKKSILLDLANLEYTPSIPGISKMTLVGGIMESPLWTVTPMVFDGDLSWDGFAAKMTQELGPATVFANNGAFLLDTDESEPGSLWVTQGGVSLKPFADAEAETLKNLKFTGAVGYYDYRNIINASKAGTDLLTREADNTAGLKDLNLLNPTFEIASTLVGYPVAAFGDWVHNTATSGSGGKDGFAIGGKIGKAATPWSLKNGWEAGYFFERLEEDAAFDEFVDSDFGGGGTNRYGHAYWVNLAVLKNSTLGVKYLTSKQLTGGKAGENRAQIDWVTKF